MKKQVQTVGCPKSMVGRVIGKNGETIRALQNYSGALIQIDQSTDPMKVTISGTPESVGLAMSMVTDIVNGTFKGFAMLRQVTNEQTKSDATMCQPVYAPGYGLIPPSQQVYTATTLSDGVSKVGFAQQGASIPTQGHNVLPTCLESHVVKPQAITPSTMLMGLGSSLDTVALGTNGLAQATALQSAAAAGCANVSNLDLFGSGSFSQTLTDSPLGASAALTAMNSLGMSLPEPSLAATALTDCTQLSAPQSSFPLDLTGVKGITASSPLSGSISPELSGGWANGLNSSSNLSAALTRLSLPTDVPPLPISSARSDVASNLHSWSQFLRASGPGSSYSDISDSLDIPSTSRISPRTNTATTNISGNNTNTSNNVVVLTDPNGRPFALDVTTGHTQWLNDMSVAGKAMPPSVLTAAAATMN